MKVRTIMTPLPFFAAQDANVKDVARIMAEKEIGVVPIVDEAHRVIGILTDRDVCKAIATTDCRACEMPAMTLASKPVISCSPDEELESALRTMRQHHIRRLAVLDDRRALVGILSIDDVVLRAEEAMEASQSAVSFSDAVQTLKVIYGERPSRRPRALPA